MFCQACGQSLGQFATSCERCGAAVESPAVAAPARPQAPFLAPSAGFAPLVKPLEYSDKSKVIAGVLQIVLGAFGAGRFYTGHIGLGIAQIAVTWLTCGVGGVWPLVDGILMLIGRVTDAQGRPLRD
jgi:TM2 domain-containing membrane protein YozV